MNRISRDKRIVILATIFSLIFGLSKNLSAATYGSGDGTAATPYQIWTAEELNMIGANSNDWNKHFILMADIDMSIYTRAQYNIIGNMSVPFAGVFDGNKHKISNLSYVPESPFLNYVGMFGYVTGKVSNLGIESVSMNGYGIIGGLAARTGGTALITSCYVTGSADGTINYVGGLVGMNEGKIINCYATMSVAGGAYVGGLVGENYGGTLSSCYATGTTNGEYYAGGLVGQNNTNSKIS